jgi:MFS family permease
MALTGRLQVLLIGPDYRRLWLAQAFSSFGVYLFASTCTVWVATQLFPNSTQLPALVGAVVLAASIPRIVAGPIAGVYADRWHARRTMIVNDSIRAGLFVVLLFVVQFGELKHDQIFIVILVCIILSEISAQFFNPSRAACMQMVIPADRRVDAASMSMFSLTGVAIIATAAGPAVFGLFGARVAIATCIATYLISCIMTLRVDDQHQPNRHVAGRFWHDFVDGARVAWGTSALRTVLLGVCLYGVSLGVNNSVLALFGLKTLGLSPSQYGLLAMMFPGGNLISAIFGGKFIKRLGMHRAYLIALTALGIGYVGYACVRQLVTACALMLTCGIIFSVYVMCQGPILQEVTLEGFMGRISAVSAPMMAVTSVVSTLLASQALSFASRHGLTAGNGTWNDLYRLFIIFGATFLLIGGGVMYAAQARTKQTPQSPSAES